MKICIENLVILHNIRMFENNLERLTK